MWPNERWRGGSQSAVGGLLSVLPQQLGAQHIGPRMRPWLLAPTAGSPIGAPTAIPAGPFTSGKRMWAETYSALQKNLFQLFLTVLCQKRKITRPMKTPHHSKEGHHFSKGSKVLLPCFAESLHEE